MGLVAQPISDEQAGALYEAIFIGLGEGANPLVEGCDHTLRHTEVWANANSIEFETLRSWLRDNGGFCDCEVLFNVMPEEDGA